MTKDQIVETINEYRQKFSPQNDQKKGTRFFDNDRVIRRLRMDFFQEESLSRLPSIDQFVARVDEEFICNNVANALREQAVLDYHYEVEKDWT
jgi:hypothetical protein